MDYDFRKIEKEWQEKWKADNVYKVDNNSPRPKCYVLDMFPYPSGAGLHVGHPLGYIASDIYSRYKRLKGFNVLHPMGFDSFGLPAEQYALETGQHPAETTQKNIATFKSQLDRIGFSYDWNREVRTSDPAFYKWTQWLFLQLFNSYFCNTQQKARPIGELVKKYESAGSKHFTAEEWKGFSEREKSDWLMKRRLAYSAFGEVNWCEALGTVLANDEVVNGVSERGGFPVEKRKMRQWFLRITAYADRLLEGLEKVDFSDAMKEMQKNWIGRSEGAEIEFDLTPSPSPEERGVESRKLRVYTTRPDTIFGVDFMVIAPEHELLEQITTAEHKEAIDKYLAYVKSRSDRERQSETKTITGCFTGAYAVNPFDGRKIPIWTAEYVLAGYGTGAIMAVPCGDQRDFLFAKHFDIPITNIIGGHYNGEEANPTKEAVLENSGFLNGMLMKDAIGAALKKIEETGIGKRKVNYKMRDAGFSRQRYWGEPFPIVWKDGVAIPLDEKELPLELPHVEKYGPGPDGEGPLANLTQWVNIDLTPDPSQNEGRAKEHSVDLTPNPSPKERGTKEHPGYMNSSASEWKNTIGFAKENRKDPTEAETAMWDVLRNRNLDHLKFRRQHPVAGYIPDFVCLEKMLIVEIDGGYHNEEEQQKFDKARAAWLEENGFSMIRFTNEEVLTKTEDVLGRIKKAIAEQDAKAAEGLLAPLPGRGGRGEVRRETSTMPGYAGSSWYFLRYMDPHNTETFCDRKASDYWNQVDLYVGGTEHAVGHLLYSRMWTKVMFDLGLIGFDEPYRKLLNQGMIQGSSRFVYRILWDLTSGDPENFDHTKLPSVFVSKGTVDLILENELSAKSNLKNLLKQILVETFKESKPEYFTIHAIKFSSIHVDVNIVDGIELDIEAFRNWKPEFNDAVFILEDGSISSPTGGGREGAYICGVETEKMSKSKYNTVNPNDLCDKYGADTFRMYEMFLGPVEASKPWDTKGIEGVHRFLRKLWRLFFDEVKGKIWTEEKASDAELKVLHRAIKKIEEDTERFSFNTAVSTFMICVNELADLKCNKKEILQPLLILLAPYAPHISEELYNQLNASEVLPSVEDLGGARTSILNASFPAYDPSLLVESSKEYPVSINGKLRTTINLALDLDQQQVEALVLQNEVVQKWLEGKPPKKIIFVKGKMVNVVV